LIQSVSASIMKAITVWILIAVSLVQRFGRTTGEDGTLVSFANKAVKQNAVSRHARGVLVDGSIIPVQVDLSGFVSIYTERLEVITDECRQNFEDLSKTKTVFLNKEQEFRDKQREFRDTMEELRWIVRNLTEKLGEKDEIIKVREEQIRILNETIQQKDDELSQKDEELERSRNATVGEDVTQQLEEKEKQIKECEGKVKSKEEIEVKIPELEGKVIDCEEKCEGKLQNLTDATDQKVAKLREKLERCKGKEKKCTKEKDRLKEEIKGVGDQLEKCETKAGKLKEKIINMKEEIATKVTDLEEKEEKLKKCKTGKTTCKTELDLCNGMKNKCTEKVRRLEKELKTCQKLSGQSKETEHPVPWEFVPEDAIDSIPFSGLKQPILVQSHDLSDPNAFKGLSYDQYKRGFSRSKSEYWIGLDALVNITQLKNPEAHNCPGKKAPDWNWMMMFKFESRNTWGWIEIPRTYVIFNEDRQRYSLRSKHYSSDQSRTHPHMGFGNLEVNGKKIKKKQAQEFYKNFVDFLNGKCENKVKDVLFHHSELPVRTEEDCDYDYDKSECVLKMSDDRKCAAKMGGGWFFQDSPKDYMACEFSPNRPFGRNASHLSSKGPNGPLLWDENDPPTKTLILLRPRPSRNYCANAFGCYKALK